MKGTSDGTMRGIGDGTRVNSVSDHSTAVKRSGEDAAGSGKDAAGGWGRPEPPRAGARKSGTFKVCDQNRDSAPPAVPIFGNAPPRQLHHVRGPAGFLAEEGLMDVCLHEAKVRVAETFLVR